ncbi:hypothetical protein [endosymbiont of Ridgeia piscesae]|jgi:hypothetical protein|uniref:Uncharacterized protein n=1 Tax=endosymbiont of Ridgeia piscesae TaxID=54398 RepID=A0A0T5Z794_9GAMM|nr:hypothetical protein [endosymbiont of Ridgeia piscesae]KRT56447.1 hypothetical protein Ga0074115_1476 [endosymbiont of Ridgeia piscesae]KRT58786.1 hypothetical protein Ga0076813_14224 [endosymbiont of Ridgeia piscesae]
MPTLTTEQVNTLQIELDEGDIIGFYSLLESYGDPHGRLGSGVTDNNSWQGQLANGFAASGASDNGVDLSYGRYQKFANCFTKAA